jgi:hypothetical protein
MRLAEAHDRGPACADVAIARPSKAAPPTINFFIARPFVRSTTLTSEEYGREKMRSLS